jgi:long-chain acyl-CoA synthetase
MLDLRRYQCIGAALHDAIERWPGETCLIEADRDRENHRLTFRQFESMALPLASALQDLGMGEAFRAAIIMTNQSKWLVSAYAIFYAGGVLIPLDFKLTGREHVELLVHSRTEVLIIEYHLWRQLQQSKDSDQLELPLILVTESPAGADLGRGRRWEDFRRAEAPRFIDRRRNDPACIVYSSGTGGRPKGCIMTHGNYLEQCSSLTALYPFWPGVRYLSILPTNHAIDFMVGFFGPFICGAAVVHLRTLRPEFVREAFPRYRITYVSLVPMVLKNLERGLRSRFAELSAVKRRFLDAAIALNRRCTLRRPNLPLSRLLLRGVHRAFGGKLRAIFVGGAFTEPSTLQFFYDLGIPVANGYGLTEAGTAVTLNDFLPFRADTVGRPLPGMEVRISEPDADGIGEVLVRSKTVMAGYLDDPELTAETIVDGWVRTGDLGRVDAMGHLQLYGRKKNMIVTEGGKNIYPEDIENVFDSLPVKEFCIFARNYLWPQKGLGKEELILVVRPEPGKTIDAALLGEIDRRNRRLPDFKRINGYLCWEGDFPRTASLKIKRAELASQLAQKVGVEDLLPLVP